MGSSAWFYLVDHDDDPSAALGRLRERLFREGAYHFRVGGGTKAPSFDDYLASMPPDLVAEQGVAVVREWHAQIVAHAARGAEKPATIEELLNAAGEEGTHSILDVPRIGATAEIDHMSPMSEEMRRSLFGSERPTREAVEARKQEIGSPAGRWSGYYFPVYDGAGVARWLCFAGVSGD